MVGLTSFCHVVRILLFQGSPTTIALPLCLRLAKPPWYKVDIQCWENLYCAAG